MTDEETVIAICAECTAAKVQRPNVAKVIVRHGSLEKLARQHAPPGAVVVVDARLHNAALWRVLQE